MHGSSHKVLKNNDLHVPHKDVTQVSKPDLQKFFYHNKTDSTSSLGTSRKSQPNSAGSNQKSSNPDIKVRAGQPYASSLASKKSLFKDKEVTNSGFHTNSGSSHNSKQPSLSSRKPSNSIKFKLTKPNKVLAHSNETQIVNNGVLSARKTN